MPKGAGDQKKVKKSQQAVKKVSKNGKGAVQKAAKTVKKDKKPRVKTKDGYKVFDPNLPHTTYSVGEVLWFAAVRNWIGKGALVEAIGKVVNKGHFDDDVPYLEISFDGLNNKVDLGSGLRKFILLSDRK